MHVRLGRPILLALAAVLAVPAAVVSAGDQGTRKTAPTTFAVFGDSPYGTTPTDTSETAKTPGFISTINADADVAGVIHVGDIHSGKQFCTEAYDREVARLWTAFSDPLVYTPGDNEWADCHKSGEGGGAVDGSGNPLTYAGGDPIANLDLVRSIFYAAPGHTLGSGTLHVHSQAQMFDAQHPEDAAYVENVFWQEAGVVFVTVNVPGGSNNDADPWFGKPATARQIDERTQRTAADVRWLDTAFEFASKWRAAGVVIVAQADMWDLDGKTAAHLANYEPIIADVARNTAAFRRPVLMFNGDSHQYRSDNPLVHGAACVIESGPAATQSCADDPWDKHPGYDVANFHRIVVHGSTTPLEWLKFTVDSAVNAPAGANAFGPFAWVRKPQPQL